MEEQPTLQAALTELVTRQQQYYRSGATRSIAFRKQQLRILRDAILRLEPELLTSLRQDLNKSEREAYATEIGIVLSEIRLAIGGVKRWSRSRRVRTPLSLFGASSRIVPEPLGTSLIIGPWNYPMHLILLPVVSAISAGNTIVLKPSELAPATSRVLAKLIKETFAPEYVAVVEGETQVSTELLKQAFDHIFFTGSSSVGRIVMEAAAKQLIPVTLELGGKSPCIVHKDAHLEHAARRIVFGKFTNAGQTCVAPDYILVHREVKQALKDKLVQEIEASYGEEPLHHPEYGKIVNERHFLRLNAYLSEGRIVAGGHIDASSCRIAPTIMDQIQQEAKVMKEEIFGPILPILEYEHNDEVVAIIQANPKPLALYVFSEDSKFQREIMERVPYGGGCLNDTVIHLASSNLPFGGIGASGIGSYHGEYGFKAFSHYKGILKQTTRFDLPFRYPASKWGKVLIRKLLR